MVRFGRCTGLVRNGGREIGKKTISYLCLFVKKFFFFLSFLLPLDLFIFYFQLLLFELLFFSFWIMKTLKQASWESYKLYI